MAIAPLILRELGKRFGRLAVLRAIDLRVEPGEVVALLGANGCGKTTLLSIASGLAAPSSGLRAYGTEAVTELDRDARMRLAFVAHTTQLYARLSARENLELPASLRGEPLTKAAGDALLERVGLAAAAERAAGTFSRGMQQRLAIARALLSRPELLLLDEPFTALDFAGRGVLTEVLASERARGAAILLSSHDLDAVADVSDRAVLLADGHIRAHAARAVGESRDDFAARVRGLGSGGRNEPVAQGHVDA